MVNIGFTKMQGIGNDYIYIDCLKSCPENLPSLSRKMSDRHFGVGGDGIILILPSEVADFKMRIFNADGSEARMCGNGARCVVKYVYDNGLISDKDITLETLSGVISLLLHTDESGEVSTVTVDMGVPSFIPNDIPVIASGERVSDFELETGVPAVPVVKINAVSIGNPHAVIFADNLDDVDIAAVGYAVENNKIFPDRANVEFIKVNSRGDITMRVWERGSGITMACGTGACASVAVAVANGLTDEKVRVHLDGGDLDIFWDRSSGHIFLTGTAKTVFTGIYGI